MTFFKNGWILVMSALLPSLPFLGSFRDAFFIGGIVCVSFVASTAFFSFSRPLFPKHLVMLAAVLSLAALGQVVRDVWGWPPFWLGSLLVLFFTEFKAEGKEIKWQRPVMLGFVFWGLMLYLGGVRFALSRLAGIEIFQGAVSVFFALGAAAWLLKSIGLLEEKRTL